MPKGCVVDANEATVFVTAWLRVTDSLIVGTNQDEDAFQLKK